MAVIRSLARQLSEMYSKPIRMLKLTTSLGLMVSLDNATRWNSTYLSLKRALRCRKRLEHFSVDFRKDLGKDYLEQDDWLTLEQLFNDLQVFYHATLRMEGHGRKGHHGSIWEALPVLEALLEKMEEGREAEQLSRRARSFRAICHQNAWEKLLKYYNLTDRWPVFFPPCIPTSKSVIGATTFEYPWMKPR
jgi:hypothetical protein